MKLPDQTLGASQIQNSSSSSLAHSVDREVAWVFFYICFFHNKLKTSSFWIVGTNEQAVRWVSPHLFGLIKLNNCLWPCRVPTRWILLILVSSWLFLKCGSAQTFSFRVLNLKHNGGAECFVKMQNGIMQKPWEASEKNKFDLNCVLSCVKDLSGEKDVLRGWCF